MAFDPASMSDDDLLTALAAGDVDEQAPGVRERLAANAAVRARWDQLRALSRELADVGTAHRAEDDAAANAFDPAAALDRYAPAGARRSARRTWLAAAFAAAAAVLIATQLLLHRGDDPNPPLGGRPGELSPNGGRWPVDEPLRWSKVRGADSYRLEIEALPAGSRMTVPGPGFPAARLSDVEWRPTPAERAQLPNPMRWRVIALDTSNDPLGTSGWAETSW